MSGAFSRKADPVRLHFEDGDSLIHGFAVDCLLDQEHKEYLLSQAQYTYRVWGGPDGFLYYRKANRDWVLVANWCFYRLYMVVRYRKPLWLRPMYEALFKRMNFVCALFDENAIELLGTDGKIMRSRRFRLSPPLALEKVMTERFGFSLDAVKELKAKLDS